MFLNNYRKKGFTLIEILIVIFLFSIVFLGILGAYQLGLKIVELSKNKVIATSIANGEIEKIRNLPYESVGVQGSFPDGVLEPVSFITQNNKEYEIKRRVDYVVDSSDGIYYPEDECPNDYKKVEITISWTGRFGENEIVFLTNTSPKNLAQECADSGGILFISVFDAYGSMVNSPLIEVKDLTSGETLKTATPNDGKHYFSLSPNTYKVVVSKDGYSTEESYGVGDTYNGQIITSPEKSNPIVLEGLVTEASFSIDQTSSILVETRGIKDLDYPLIGNISFILRGEKKVGTNSEEESIYKYSEVHNTGSMAEVNVLNLEWDSYNISITNSSLNLVGVESPPEFEIEQPISLLPGSNLVARSILQLDNSLLTIVRNDENQEPIFSAKIKLWNEDIEYEEERFTDENGQAYFLPLEVANYNLEVEASGYSSISKSIFVSGDKTDIIELEQIE